LLSSSTTHEAIFSLQSESGHGWIARIERIDISSDFSTSDSGGMGMESKQAAGKLRITEGGGTEGNPSQEIL